MGRCLDLTGDRYNMLTVLYRDHNDHKGRVTWRCLCDCGKETTVLAQRLRGGHTKSCGCLNRATPYNFKDLSGQKFGRLTVLERDGSNKQGKARWRCLCECGKTTLVCSRELLCGDTNSCGCLQRELTSKRAKTHGKRHTRLYRIWAHMKARTTRQTCSTYKWYGQRGIRVCKEWLDDFGAFYKWAIENGYDDTLTIDRIDNNKGYCPENCRWVDMYVQANNKNNNVRVTMGGETRTLAEWCRIMDFSMATVRKRRERGITGSALFDAPKRASGE